MTTTLFPGVSNTALRTTGLTTFAAACTCLWAVSAFVGVDHASSSTADSLALLGLLGMGMLLVSTLLVVLEELRLRSGGYPLDQALLAAPSRTRISQVKRAHALSALDDFANSRNQAVIDGRESKELAALLVEKFAEGLSVYDTSMVRHGDDWCVRIDPGYHAHRRLRYQHVVALALTEPLHD